MRGRLISSGEEGRSRRASSPIDRDAVFPIFLIFLGKSSEAVAHPLTQTKRAGYGRVGALGRTESATEKVLSSSAHSVHATLLQKPLDSAQIAFYPSALELERKAFS